MITLTDAERDALLGHVGAYKWESKGLPAAAADFFAEAERILTARESDLREQIAAGIEALPVDPLTRQSGRLQHATRRDAARIARGEEEK